MMKIKHIDNYTAGWLVGNFEPSLIHSNHIELGVKHVPAGTPIERHYQKESTEYNYIASGSVMANGHSLSVGDIFVYEPGEVTELQILTDAIIVVFKSPSLGYDDKVVI